MIVPLAQLQIHDDRSGLRKTQEYQEYHFFDRGECKYTKAYNGSFVDDTDMNVHSVFFFTSAQNL